MLMKIKEKGVGREIEKNRRWRESRLTHWLTRKLKKAYQRCIN